jgi:hypothetical protein
MTTKLVISAASSVFNKDCMGKGVAQKPLAPAQVYVLVPRELE